MQVRVVRNQDVRRVLIGIPREHRHIRVILDIGDAMLVLQEATVSNIMRAFLNILLHPQRAAIELKCTKLKERKSGYAEYQLIESDRSEKDVLAEISKIIAGGCHASL